MYLVSLKSHEELSSHITKLCSHTRDFSSGITEVTWGIIHLASLVGDTSGVVHLVSQFTLGMVHLTSHSYIKIQCPHADSKSITTVSIWTRWCSASPYASVSNWAIQEVSSHTSKSICCYVQLNCTGYVQPYMQVHLLLGPTELYRVDYVQTTGPSVATPI